MCERRANRRERWTHSSDYVAADRGALRLTCAACNAVMQASRRSRTGPYCLHEVRTSSHELHLAGDLLLLPGSLAPDRRHSSSQLPIAVWKACRIASRGRHFCFHHFMPTFRSPWDYCFCGGAINPCFRALSNRFLTEEGDHFVPPRGICSRRRSSWLAIFRKV